MEEIWKDIKNYEGFYQISNLGRVKSLARFKNGKSGSLVPVKEIILKQKINEQGYALVHLRKNREQSWPTIHRLVAEAFIPNVDNKPTVNHVDCNKMNNTVSNLEWSLHSEQMQHAVENNLLEINGKPKFSKAFKQSILDYFNTNEISIKKLAIHFNISERTAGRIVNDGVSPRKTTRVKRSTGEIIVDSIISKESVEEIKRLRNEGYTLDKLSKLFDRSISQIHRITKGQSRSNDIE